MSSLNMSNEEVQKQSASVNDLNSRGQIHGDDHMGDYDIELSSDLNNTELTLFGYDIEFWNRTKTLPFMRTKDKVIFLLGVANFGALMYFVGGNQYVLPWIYSIKYPILIIMRYYSYKKHSWHYFLLDFCYYANILLLANLWIWYDNYEVFVATFCIIHGPLLVAVPLFRNSLVFHSIDKTTSCFIHLSPALVAFVCRWYLNPDAKFAMHVCKSHTATSDDCSVTWTQTLGYPALFVIIHQFVYYIITNCILKKQISDDPNSLTTYLYLVGSKPHSTIYKMLGVFGDQFRELLFAIGYAAWAIFTIIPAVLYYKYFWLNLTVLILVGLCSIWNGANFYIEVFSRKYEGWGEKLTRKLTQLAEHGDFESQKK